MRPHPLELGDRVKIKPLIKEYGGKLGTVVYEGKELGWHVVKVKFERLPRPVSFSPDEVETIGRRLGNQRSSNAW
ncbi:MAG: hypothetical protein NTW03_12935 [Verrucomicrobia bacterium]|nr:hypothetical protein [Verrucomicrobiota bacterium]